MYPTAALRGHWALTIVGVSTYYPKAVSCLQRVHPFATLAVAPTFWNWRIPFLPQSRLPPSLNRFIIHTSPSYTFWYTMAAKRKLEVSVEDEVIVSTWLP